MEDAKTAEELSELARAEQLEEEKRLESKQKEEDVLVYNGWLLELYIFFIYLYTNGYSKLMRYCITKYDIIIPINP